jgi:MFS transporter, FLVCR family, MFS-domain-containing protein 7
MLMTDLETIVKPHNTAALYVLMVIIGGCSVTMLPVGLELACELTRNADGSSAIIWFMCVSLDVTYPFAA